MRPPISVGPSSVERRRSLVCDEAPVRAQLLLAVLGGELEPVVGGCPGRRASRGSSRCRRSVRLLGRPRARTRRCPAHRERARRQSCAAISWMRALEETRGRSGRFMESSCSARLSEIVERSRCLDGAQDQHGRSRTPPPPDAERASRASLKAGFELFVGGVHRRQHADLGGKFDPVAHQHEALLRTLREQDGLGRSSGEPSKGTKACIAPTPERAPTAFGSFLRSDSKRFSMRRPRMCTRPSGPR